jgi:hypothetical protein
MREAAIVTHWFRAVRGAGWAGGADLDAANDCSFNLAAGSALWAVVAAVFFCMAVLGVVNVLLMARSFFSADSADAAFQYEREDLAERSRRAPLRRGISHRRTLSKSRTLRAFWQTAPKFPLVFSMLCAVLGAFGAAVAVLKAANPALPLGGDATVTVLFFLQGGAFWSTCLFYCWHVVRAAIKAQKLAGTTEDVIRPQLRRQRRLLLASWGYSLLVFAPCLLMLAWPEHRTALTITHLNMRVSMAVVAALTLVLGSSRLVAVLGIGLDTLSPAQKVAREAMIAKLRGVARLIKRGIAQEMLVSWSLTFWPFLRAKVRVPFHLVIARTDMVSLCHRHRRVRCRTRCPCRGLSAPLRACCCSRTLLT